MRRIYSHHFGETFEITDVPERDHILLHSGNFAGDRSKGKRTDSNGCVLTGLYPGRMYEQMCVMSSRFAHTAFMQMMKGVDQTVVKILNAKETSEC